MSAIDVFGVPCRPVSGFDVVLLAGQSNMVGLGTPIDLTYLDNPDPRIQQWAGSGTYLGQQIQAIDALQHHNPVANKVGPGISFAKWYVRKYGRNVLLVPTAHGATGFTTTSVSPAPAGYHTVAGGGSWDKDATDGGTNLYEFAVAQVNAAIASNPNNRIVAILWQQGPGDGAFVGAGVDEAEYQAFMDALVDNFRADITGAANVPILIGREPVDWYALHPEDEFLDDVHLNMPVAKDLVAWVEPGPVGATLDGVHLSAAEQRLAGSVRYPEAFALALANTSGLDPVPPTDMTFDQSGTTVEVRWSRPLGRATDYLVEKNTGSGWTTVTRTPSTEPAQEVAGLTLGATVGFRVSTINDEGTSDPLTGSYELQEIPGTPTGLTGTAYSFRQALEWDAVADADEYLVEYKASSSGTWLSAGTVTEPAKSVGGLSASTSYDFRVSSVNSAGTSGASSTFTQSTTAPTTLAVDVGTDPIWAYSVRKVRAAYAGAAIRVRRSSDNTQQDIAFDGNGLLDTAALLTFVGAGNGFITKWYNQGTSGATQDLANTTAASQPRIVSAGVVDVKNTLPALVFDGTDDFIFHQNPALLASAGGVSALVVAQTRRANSVLFAEIYNPSSTSLARWVPFYNGPGLQEYVIVYNDLGSEVTVATPTAITDDDSLNQESCVDTLTSVQLWRNAVSEIGPTSYSRSGAHTVNLFNVGVQVTPTWHQGAMSELVFWGTALSDEAREAGEANQKGFFGTP